MPIVKTTIDRNPRAFTFDALSETGFPLVATLGAGVANTVVQGYVVQPFAYKVAIVSVFCTALDSLAGTDKFNLVVGTGAYTQGTTIPTDNSFDPQSTTTVGINVPQSSSNPAVLGGLGYPTNFATAGQALFSADQALTATAGVGVATTTGQPALATPTTGGGGVWRFVPTYYDAVIPAGAVLTLRAVTTASTGSISNLSVRMAILPVFTRGEAPYYTDVLVQPGIEW